MPSRTSYFKTERFLKEASFDRSGLKCVSEDRVFQKDDTWTHDEADKVINLCSQYRNDEIDTIVVKGEKDLTVWIEDKSTAIPEPSDRVSASTDRQSMANPQFLPTKTVIKKYRGSEYEETVVDWAAVQQIQQSKPRRKYRGQYID